VPGFSAECDMGQHPGCAMPPGQCRCICHPWTQELMRKKPNPPENLGGLKRKGKAAIVAKPVRQPRAALPPKQPQIILHEAPQQEDEPDETVLHNTCPKCMTRAKATDQFCRKDGTRLCLGKPCPRCEAPANEPDEFCWQCGWKLADPYISVQEIPLRGMPMPSVASDKARTPDPLPQPGAPTADLSLPPGAEAILSERHQPGTVQVSQAEAALPSEPPAGEDPILRLRRTARERGLLPPEIVVS
jgi:hypothetical protein